MSFFFPSLFFLIGERMPVRIYTVPESNRIWSGNNLPPTSTNSNTQAGMVMTTIIRDRTMLSDRITKWARRCFQNRYDCRGFATPGRCCARKCLMYIIIEIRCRVNSDDFETTGVEVRFPCQYIKIDLKYIFPSRLWHAYFFADTLYTFRRLKMSAVLALLWKYPRSSLFVFGI